MSKKIKAANKERNLQAKRSRKATNKAKYAALKAAGQNSKSFRAIKSGKKHRKATAISHIDGPCGNVACVRCFPDMERPMLKVKKVA